MATFRVTTLPGTTLELTDRYYHVAWDEGPTFEARLGTTAGRLTRWNGFVCPYFTRAEIDRYKAWADEHDSEDAAGIHYDTVEWVGDTLRITSTDGVETWVDDMPPIGGLYPLGAWGWTWMIAEPDRDPDVWEAR